MTPAHEEILTRLQAGTRVDRIADLVGVDRRTVIGVAHQHRYRITRHGTAELIGDQPVTTPTHRDTARPHSNLGTLAVAVNELTRHKDPRVAKAASKCREQLVKLIDAVSDYDEKAEARAEVERLEAELAEAKAKLRRPPSIGQPDVDSKKVRAWAAENGVDCPKVGRVPQHVVAAYETAQGEAA